MTAAKPPRSQQKFLQNRPPQRLTRAELPEYRGVYLMGYMSMIIGDRLRSLREAKKLSQGDIEARCGLLRAYISRIEHGHTIPSLETLEKLARALEVPLYQLLSEGEQPFESANLAKRKTVDELVGRISAKDGRFLKKLWSLLGRISEADQRLLLHMAQKMAKR